MASASKRYFSGDDVEIGVTPSQLKRLGKSRQLEYLTSWFHSMYEDPAMETSYNGQEGGYLYNHGGPYDARDEIGGEFDGIVSEEVIEQAIEDVESKGTLDWAPTYNHPDRADEGMEDGEPSEPFPIDLDEVNRRLKAGVRPHYGDEYDRRTRGRILRDIEELEFDLPTGVSDQGGIGHNRPPADMQMTMEEISETRNALIEIRVELSRVEPDAVRVADLTGRLKKLWEGAKHHAKLVGAAFSTSVGSAAGTVVGTAIGGGIVTGGAVLLGHIVLYVIEWLSYVTLPF
jgi:hypothetical protein